MKRAKPFMRKEKPPLGIRLEGLNENTKRLGIIKIGKCRPDKTKYVLLDFECDEKAKKELFKIGMELLAKDKDEVIKYAIVKAIKQTAKIYKKGKKKTLKKSNGNYPW